LILRENETDRQTDIHTYRQIGRQIERGRQAQIQVETDRQR